jgi:hypothetical protein
VGNRFVVKIDHNSLKYLLDQKDLSQRQHNWVSKIQAFDFDIEYVKEKGTSWQMPCPGGHQGVQ